MRSGDAVTPPEAGEDVAVAPTVNSHLWWETYFSHHWEANRGSEQTRHFMSLIVNNLPIPEIGYLYNEPRTILDWGCAFGEGSRLLLETFFRAQVTGLDHSATAIHEAALRHPDCEFILADGREIERAFDVVVCSNCLEHFADPLAIMAQQVAGCRNLYIVLVPYQEDPLHESHLTSFDERSFPQQIGDFSQLYCRVCEADPTFWNGRQMLVAYGSSIYQRHRLPDPSPAIEAERAKWDHYYADLPLPDTVGEGMAQFNREFCAAVLALLSPGSSVLEAGCGAGWQSLALARTGQVQVSLLDFSLAALGYARRLFERAGVVANFQYGELQIVGEPSYDLVFNAGVLEHYPFDEQVALLRAMARRSHTFVIALVPNQACYWYWIWRVQASAAGRWPFGQEAPVNDLETAFATAGLRYQGQRYMATAWMAELIDHMTGLEEALRRQIAALHDSPLIPSSQKTYLLAALGSVTDVELSFPTTWCPSSPSALAGEAEMKAILADALALRLGAEERLRHLEAELTQRAATIGEQATRITTLQENLAEKNQALTTAQEALARYDHQVRDLEGKLVSAEHTVAELRQRNPDLQTRDRQISHLEAHAAQQAEGIAWLRQELVVRDERLSQIYQSRLWQSVDTYWKSRRAAGRIAHLLMAGPDAMLLAVGRRVLPDRFKLLLKRNWQPTARLVPAETASVAQATAAQSIPAAGGGTKDLPLPTAYDVVCFSIIDWDFRWQRPQQIMSQFADHGHRVFFISTSRFVAAGQLPVEVQALRNNVWEVRLASPRPIDVYGGELPPDLTEAVTTSLRALRDEFNITCAVSVVQVATWASAALACREAFSWRIVYDCMDEWNTFPGMKEAMLTEERQLVKAADLLIVSGQRLWEKWASQNRNTVLARNGTNFEHFANSRPNALLADAARPIVGYFGAIADWFDLDLMVRLARERPHYTFVLLGGIFNVSMAELEQLSNVRILGQKPYELMPAYLLQFNACIIPFKVNAITEATDPVKFYEYISQGRPVIASRMFELLPYHEYLYIADDHDDFIRKVDQAVREDDPMLRERRIALARQNTWQARFALIERGIRQAHPLVSIVVVTYNNLTYTKMCLDSVLRNSLYPSVELVVVDNASTDGTPTYLEELQVLHDNVRVVLNRHNAGFAAANNQGIAAAMGQRLVLLNNDTVAPNGWLPKLLRHLDRPEIGLVGAVTNFSGNESRIAVTYTDLSGLEEFAAHYTRAHDGQVFDIRVAAMYCVALRRDTYERIGPLDEQFSIGMFEDDDYSHRVRLAGLRVVCAEDAFIHHVGQASFKQLSPTEYQAIWERNQGLFEQKWNVVWQGHQARSQ